MEVFWIPSLQFQVLQNHFNLQYEQLRPSLKLLQIFLQLKHQSHVSKFQVTKVNLQILHPIHKLIQWLKQQLKDYV